MLEPDAVVATFGAGASAPCNVIEFGAMATVVDPAHPLDRRPNTWVIRYGDAEWKQFLDFWCTYLVVNGEIDKLFKHHMGKLGAA